MNRNAASTGRERRDRAGFRWAGRSLALALWLISALLWCVLMRQSYIAMPWDDISAFGVKLYEMRGPFAAAGMSVGLLGTGICLGCLFWLCLSCVTGAGWGISLRRVLAAGLWGSLPGVLTLAGTVGCLTTVIFPEAARYWGVADVSSPGVRAFSVMDWSDLSWWNPAWLYVRMGILAVLAWSMAQIWMTLTAGDSVWKRSFHRGAAAFSMIAAVMALGVLGFDVLAGPGGAALSMFPVYMIAWVLLASLAFAVLAAVCLRRLEGGKSLSWTRMGGMLTAMVLIKAYITYSQYLITWYASIPGEMTFYTAALSGWVRECWPPRWFWSCWFPSSFFCSPRCGTGPPHSSPSARASWPVPCWKPAGYSARGWGWNYMRGERGRPFCCFWRRWEALPPFPSWAR